MSGLLANLERAFQVLYPDRTAFQTDLFFLGLLILVASLINGHDQKTMRRRLAFTFGFTVYIVTRAVLLQYHYNGTISYPSIVLGSTSFVLMLIGSMLSFMLRKTIKHPGGLGGFLWKALARIGDWMGKIGRKGFYHVLNDGERLLLYGEQSPDSDWRPMKPSTPASDAIKIASIVVTMFVIASIMIACTVPPGTAAPPATATEAVETEPPTQADVTVLPSPTDLPTFTPGPATETPSDTPEPGEPTSTLPVATPQPDTATPTLEPDDGIIIGDDLLSWPHGMSRVELVNGASSIAYELKDPAIFPSDLVGYPHVVSPHTQVWYAALDYYCSRQDLDNDGELDTPTPPCRASKSENGDPNVEMGRPEYVMNRCPPKDRRCQEDKHYNMQLFCYQRPCYAGWQWEMELSDWDAKEMSALRQCQFQWDMYIWSPDPASSDLFASGAITGDTDDDRRSVAMVFSVGDDWMLRDRHWFEDRIYGYPNNPVKPGADPAGRPPVPFDRWQSYTETFTLPEGLDRFVVAVGIDAVWGWQNNAYVKGIHLICDEVYFYPMFYPTPTQLPPADSGQGGGGLMPIMAQSLEDGVPVNIVDFLNSGFFALFLKVAGVFIFIVPLVAASAGILVGLIVDGIKAVLLYFGKDLGDEWGGRLAFILNSVILVAIFIAIFSRHGDLLPEEVIGVIKTLTETALVLLTFLGMLKGSRMAHGQLKKTAPIWFSQSYRDLLTSSPSYIERQSLKLLQQQDAAGSPKPI